MKTSDMGRMKRMSVKTHRYGTMMSAAEISGLPSSQTVSRTTARSPSVKMEPRRRRVTKSIAAMCVCSARRSSNGTPQHRLTASVAPQMPPRPHSGQSTLAQLLSSYSSSPSSFMETARARVTDRGERATERKAVGWRR